MNRRDFVKLGTPPVKQLGSGGILDAGVGEQQRLMEVGKLTSHWLTSQYLTRIKLAGKSGIEINPHALKLALDMDRERNLKRVRGPLHGIPVLLKEGADVAAAQLREAGAVIIGKVQQDQLASLTLSAILGVEMSDPIMREPDAGTQQVLLDLKARGVQLVDRAISALVFQHVAESGLDAHRVQVPDDVFQRSILQ
jgi:hypothetical protein